MRLDQPALAGAGPQTELFKKILTETAFDGHVAEITFPAPVVLTVARVGAAPSAGPAGQRSQLLLFAQDAGAPATARFVQLCPGFEQPESGSRIVQLQPCVTKRVLLRGRYQTVPLTLLGFDLEAAAAAAPPPQQRRISLAGALQWLQQQQQDAAVQGDEVAGGAAATASCMPAVPLQPAVEAALAQLVAYWQLVDTSERLMALHPAPRHALKAAAAVADAVCAQLANGSFGQQQVPAPEQQQAEQGAEQQPSAEQPAKQQDKRQDGAEGQPERGGQAAGVKEEEPGDVAMPDAEQPPSSPAAQQQASHPHQQGAPAQQGSQAQQQALLRGEALLSAAADMVLGWCGLLGAGGAGRTASAMRCSAAGLAAAVLLCSCSEGARMLVARWGAVLLDDVLTMPLAPPSFTRNATAACLLIARHCGALGAASLLGLWRPPRGIVWQSRSRQPADEVAAAAADAAAVLPGGQEAGDGVGEAPAPMEEDDEAAAAAAAQAAAAFQEQLMQEAEGQQAGEEGDQPDHAALQEQWRQERLAHEAQLLYQDSDEEEEEGSGSSGDEDEGADNSGEDARREGQPEAPGASGSAEQQAQQAAAAAAAEQAAFGDDIYADAAGDEGQEAAAAAAASAGGAPVIGGEPDADDLYGDLGPVVPQVDGAADSPPRRGRRRGADSEERWELGRDDDSHGEEERGGGKRRREERRERSRDRGDRRRKDSRRDRSRGDRSRDRSREGRSRGDREAADERRRRAAAEEEEARRRQRRLQEEEEEERRRRWAEREEEDRRRRYQEQQRRLEEEQRQAEQEERRRLDQLRRQEEKRQRRWGPLRPQQQAQPPAAPASETERWQLYEAQQAKRMQNYWQLKQRAYVGCAQHLARHLLAEVQPPLFSLLARQLLHLLRAHEAAATFQAAALQLVQAHSSGGDGSAHRAALEAGGAAAAAQQAAVLAVAMAQQLAVGAKPLLAVLASSSGGRRLLLRDTAVLEQLLLATDAGCLAAAWQPAPSAEGAALLQHMVVAEAAAAQLCSAQLDSEAFAAASETAAALLQECGPTGRLALVQALALRAPECLPRLLLMLRMHCALLRAACGTGAAACPEPGSSADAAALAELQRQYEPDFQLLLAAAPACAPAAQLLMALLRGCHPGALAAWQQQGVALQVAAATELRQLVALPPDAAGMVGGLGAARAALASIKGAVAAVMTAQQERGLPSLLTFLGAELPQLGAPEGAGSSSPQTVRWEDVELLFCDPEKLACCEQCLRLLAAHLWAPGAAGRAAAYAADAQEGLPVLLRALLTGCELVEASAADDSWQVLAGHSIDAGEAAACRLRALSFLEAAAAATSCLLQHLRGSTCPVKSSSLLAGLLRAHAALCCQDESLACMLGGKGGADAAAAGGMQAALVARYHLASCLRCYVEAAQPWQPPLLQQVFWGTPAPGLEPGHAAAQTPGEMFAAACLLGDLFPPEWPAVGRKVTQAPPSDRRYRAALATAIEPCGASFRRLIAAALTSESRLLRAAVVRVLARAAGLGGGMGPFLVEPLLEELQTAAESPAPLHDARRLLEVIVPLVYRPAIKSAMLAAPFTSTLAQLLGVVAGKLASADEGAEAGHVCTMLMEALVVLLNHEVCIDPMAPPKRQQVEDMPPVGEAVPLARTLLELLPSMGANALVAHRALRMLAAAETGRLALRRAVVALHAAATGSEAPSGAPGDVAVAQAAQWVANRYWAAAERLTGSDAAAVAAGGLEGLRAAFADVLNIMQQICVAADEDSVPKPLSAQQRFVGALQAALHAAAEAGLDTGGDEHRWEGPGAAEALAADLVHDPASGLFWRNVRARASAQSQASAAHAMRRFARREPC
ncbi:G-patch domain-containing [Chlorella sorokiniana]|uniref:G-patch domain-containing n=1 Tax=Chlorella sorokiniana TaxID=3076 RepID=A0A2P6TL65_CHLSO|nr:G-patch domain-containing [Chlorella sorokiniana]|eukprot:PRW45038.1 G-patch domain-containing [Chlorella sorokiniana]